MSRIDFTQMVFNRPMLFFVVIKCGYREVIGKSKIHPNLQKTYSLLLQDLLGKMRLLQCLFQLKFNAL